MTQQTFRIRLKSPKQSMRYFRLFWFLLLVMPLVFLFKGNFTVALTGLAIVSLGFAWQWRQFQRLYDDYREILVQGQNWFLIPVEHSQAENKQSIEPIASTAIWPLWIKLDYKFSGFDIDKRPRKHSLMIFKDSVSDEDYRHLSRLLLFYKPA